MSTHTHNLIGLGIHIGLVESTVGVYSLTTGLIPNTRAVGIGELSSTQLYLCKCGTFEFKDTKNVTQYTEINGSRPMQLRAYKILPGYFI